MLRILSAISDLRQPRAKDVVMVLKVKLLIVLSRPPFVYDSPMSSPWPLGSCRSVSMTTGPDERGSMDFQLRGWGRAMGVPDSA